MRLSLPPPLIVDVNEQTSGVYWATITDDEKAFLPGNVLNTLALSLYAIKSDGTLQYINGRQAQTVLNANDVVVYGTLQTRPDGLTYNLIWRFQVGDTTLVENLPFERHIGRFDYTWPNNVGGQGAGKHEVVLNVKNLVGV